jgi:hypothetical protein
MLARFDSISAASTGEIEIGVNWTVEASTATDFAEPP